MRHDFPEPIVIQLPGYPVAHRVLGVEYVRCPNRCVRGKFAYAIADWGFPQFPESRHVLRDLKTRMILANALADCHPFPLNAEKWVK